MCNSPDVALQFPVVLVRVGDGNCDPLIWRPAHSPGLCVFSPERQNEDTFCVMPLYPSAGITYTNKIVMFERSN